MVKGKILKTLSTIFECVGIGGLVVYFYNYFTLNGKYDSIPKELNANLNTYLLVGVSGLLLFIIFKILKYFATPREKEYEQVEMDLEETPKNVNETYNYIQEPRYSYEEKYVVPTDKQTTCSNCGKIVDKNATICLHCGFLLQSLQTMKDKFDEQRFIIQSFKKLEEKFEEFLNKLDKRNEKLYEQSYNTQQHESIIENKIDQTYETKIQYQVNDEKIEDSRYKYDEPTVEKETNNSFLFTYFLTKAIPVIIIISLLALGGYMLITKLNTNNTVSDVGNKSSFYDIANNIINEVETKYKNNEIKLNKNTVYFTLSDLNYSSKEYNANKSYIAINVSDKNNIQYYISLLGTNDYNNYGINITEKKDLDVTDVVINNPMISEIDGKLLVDNGTGVTIYYKE